MAHPAFITVCKNHPIMGLASTDRRHASEMSDTSSACGFPELLLILHVDQLLGNLSGAGRKGHDVALLFFAFVSAIGFIHRLGNRSYRYDYVTRQACYGCFCFTVRPSSMRRRFAFS